MLRPLGRPCKRAPQAELGRGTGEAWRRSSTLARSPPPGTRNPPSWLCRSPWPFMGSQLHPRALWPSYTAADGSPQEGGGSWRGTQAQKRARQLHPEEPTPLTQASLCVSHDSTRAPGTLLGSGGSGGETSPSHLPSPCPPRAPDPELCPFTFRGGGPCRQVLNFLQALQLLGVASAMHRGEGHQAHL